MKVCRLFREDYFECLHHRREYTMVKQVMEQEKVNKAMEAADRNGSSSDGGGGGH